jgi:NAD+ synthase (glutamine-hydrolysing)
VVVFPELALTGYPPEDLLFKPRFIKDNLENLARITQEIRNIVAIVGFVDRIKENLYNSAAIIYKQKILGVYHKIFLPNYGIFDEKRYFKPGGRILLFKIGEVVSTVNICEDIWYLDGPVKEAAKRGANIIFNLNASPYHLGKIKQREDIIAHQAKKNNIFVVYANLVGGQDELVFDGQSRIADNQGKIIAGCNAFKEELLSIDLTIPIGKGKSKEIIHIPKRIISKKPMVLPKKPNYLEIAEEVYQALVLGLKDYVGKNGFKKVVLGLSGGVDSSLVATLAVDALGKENVTGVFMPSRYTSLESKEDVKELVNNLGIRLITVSIEPIYKVYLMLLEPHFLEKQKDITEENLQARIRGNILMAFSNKFGWLVLTMVDKSEYKRRQSPPGIKITPKAFGKDRRMPITNKYRG